MILDGQSKICNWLYNHLLEMVKNDKLSGLLEGRNLRNEIPKLKLFINIYYRIINLKFKIKTPVRQAGALKQA